MERTHKMSIPSLVTFILCSSKNLTTIIFRYGILAVNSKLCIINCLICRFQDTDCQICKNNLISNNSAECEFTLVKIKDAIIGSNRQKGVLISQGLVPAILQLCCDKEASWHIRVNAFIILGKFIKYFKYIFWCK